MIFRVTDIETIADDTVWSRGEPPYRLAPLWVPEEARMGVRPAGVEQTDPVPPPQACRVVAISSVDVEMDPSLEHRYRFDRCYSECLWSTGKSPERADAAERQLLSTFGASMASPDINLVTWNGRGFDLPVIAMRSLKHGLSCGWYYKPRDMRYRFSTEGHLDLMDFLGDYGACRFMKLGDVARLIGLPGKVDMSGDKVAERYRQAVLHPTESEQHQEVIKRYCLQDSIQTAILFLRTRHLLGKIDPEQYNVALGTFRASKSVTETLDLNWDRLLL